jgi:hypothetical protein
MIRPEKGDIAICQHGHIGLVTEVAYKPDRKGTIRKLWTGIHLDADDIGARWESRAPRRLLTVSDYLE